MILIKLKDNDNYNFTDYFWKRKERRRSRRKIVENYLLYIWHIYKTRESPLGMLVLKTALSRNVRDENNNSHWLWTVGEGDCEVWDLGEFYVLCGSISIPSSVGVRGLWECSTILRKSLSKDTPPPRFNSFAALLGFTLEEMKQICYGKVTHVFFAFSSLLCFQAVCEYVRLMNHLPSRKSETGES